MCDLNDPINVFVPGHERQNRAKNLMSSKVYIMNFVCPVTKLNLQIIIIIIILIQ